MLRDFFRWFIRFLLVILMMAGCCESFYFLGEISETYTTYPNQHYKNEFSDGY